MEHRCNVCQKSFLRKSSLDKHKILCDFNHKSARELKVQAQEAGDIPTHLQLVQIVQELSTKLQSMEEKIVHMHKWIERRKQKINVLQWLNSQYCSPTTNWETWISQMKCTCDDIEYLFENSAQDTIELMISKHVTEESPVKAFEQKNGILYIVDNAFMWKVMDSSDLLKLTKHIQSQMFQQLDAWRVLQLDLIDNKELFLKFNKAIIKAAGISQSADGIMHKVKNKMHALLKTDLQLMVQLDFE